MHVRFGELLGRVTPLSGHDVAEILEDQTATRRRFGEIALAWGLCEPQHLWRAWADQCADGDGRVDLAAIGIDAAAVSLLPHDVARRLGMIPVRSFEDEVIIATSSPVDGRADAVAQHLAKRCRFVMADAKQISDAIERYYLAA